MYEFELYLTAVYEKESILLFKHSSVWSACPAKQVFRGFKI